VNPYISITYNPISFKIDVTTDQDMWFTAHAKNRPPLMERDQHFCVAGSENI